MRSSSLDWRCGLEAGQLDAGRGCGAGMGTVVLGSLHHCLGCHCSGRQPTYHPTAQDEPLEFGTDLLSPWKASQFWLGQARQLGQGPISNFERALVDTVHIWDVASGVTRIRPLPQQAFVSTVQQYPTMSSLGHLIRRRGPF
jgi:hypothetical protein